MWQCPRSTVSQIFVIIEGSGSSTISNKEFHWASGDMLAVPSWLEHAHTATHDAVLLRVSDEPLLRRLSWVRTR